MVEYAVISAWANKVRVVHQYLERPATWPDGIDFVKYGLWYTGREDYWRECAGHLTGNHERGFGWEGRLDDEAAYAKWANDRAAPAKLLPKPPDEKVKALKALAKAMVEADGDVRIAFDPDAAQRNAIAPRPSRGVSGGRPKTIEGDPWIAAGMSRRTWYRLKKAQGAMKAESSSQ